MSQQKQQQQGRDSQQNKGGNRGGNNANRGGNQQGANRGGNQQGAGRGGNTQQGANRGGNQQGRDTQENKSKVDNSARNIRTAGVVRGVQSGDTVIVAKGNGQETITLTLLSLKAPLLGKKNKDEITKDQPFAWESREFLRNLLIGKSVVYRVEHEFGSRTYGEIWLGEDNVRYLIAQKGWAEVNVKEKKDKEGQALEHRKEDQELLALQEAAKAKKLGIWGPGKPVRAVKYHENKKETDPDALFAFFEKNKGKTLNGVVEQVKTGSTLKVYVHSTGDEFTVNLSGVHCPVYRYNNESASDPFAGEAKFFTEFCLLHKNVSVTLESMDKLNNYFGTVIDTAGKRNIVPLILKSGLGSFVEWNAPTQHVKEWKDAENEAKEAKLRIWKKRKAADVNTKAATNVTTSTGIPKEFLGTVVEVLSPSSFVVRIQKGESYSDVTVNLSSIRVPRLAPKNKLDTQSTDPNADNSEKEKKSKEKLESQKEDAKIQNAYALQGKEFLRKELIGKKVKATFDYTSPPYQPPGSNKTLPAKHCYSVYVGGKTNIAARLVQKGLATVSMHQEGEARSPEYKELILAEKAAKQEGAGQHAAKSKAPIVHINDLSVEGEPKCRHFLVALQRVERVPAVVEYLFTGSRFKVYIPSQGLTIAFALQGIMSERTVKNDKVKTAPGSQPDFRALYPVQDAKGNPIPANIALHFARDHLHQRDVEITVVDLDKAGTFLGTLVINKTDYTLKLLEGAHAKLHIKSAEKLPGYKQYLQVEENSKKQHKGVWWDYNEEEERKRREEINQKHQEAREEREATKQKEKTMSLTVTEIMTGSTFFFQKATDETKDLMENMMSDLQSREWDTKKSYTPTYEGEWVVAKFSVDNNWYRAEVLQILDAGQFELRYVDYGNTEIVKANSIRELDEDLDGEHVPAQAKRGKLAYIRTPALDDEYGEDAAASLKEMVWGKTLLANIQYVDYEGSESVYHISLGEEETKTNINGALVIQGLARVESRRQTRILNKSFYEVLQKEEAKARSARLCIWQYGAIPDSDEEREWSRMLK